MVDLLKFMHCGCEYRFSSGGISPEIFGDGSDGDCTICYDECTKGNYFMEAKEYNFTNFTVCEGVKLRFCGAGVPIIRVTECFDNQGVIELRNPLLNTCPSYGDQYLGKVIYSKCNTLYDCANATYTCLNDTLTLECLSANGGKGGTTQHSQYGSWEGEKGGYGGGAGCNGCDSCNGNTQGGASIYANAGGGGGGGKGSWGQDSQYAATNGCDAPGDGIGGDGGKGGGLTYAGRCVAYGAGGGGGYGYCQGGNGGNANTCGSGDGCVGCAGGGNGGNSYLGKGGNGGNGWQRGCGGCSYCGDGGTGAIGGNTYYGNGGAGCSTGGCSMFGNGGNGGTNGGRSIYGNGVGPNSRGLDATGTNSRAWGGIYGFGLFAYDICNSGCISGRGGDACIASDGAQMHIAYHIFNNSGFIDCRKGNGTTPGAFGFLCTYSI